MQQVFIYGAGRVGRSFGRAIEERGANHGLMLNGAWNRSFKRALETSQILDVEVSSGDALPDPVLKADVVVLSVTDDAIVEVAQGLSRHLSKRQCLIHTSGSLPSTIMRSDHTQASLGGCHPLQSLAKDDGDYTLLHGATFAIEGEPEAMEAAQRLAEAAGGDPIAIQPKGKVYYHAAAVVSANYLTVLVDAARVLYREAGLDTPTAVKTLLPLLRGTLQNLEEAVQNAEPDTATEALATTLTGPVRRGDVQTVQRHLRALRALERAHDNEAGMVGLYQTLGRRAAVLARRAGLEDEEAAALERILGRDS
ncbi:MAG: DUF2520 domain-containing protein [Myxococcota bacterium]